MRLKNGLLSYFDHQISSGPKEGPDNKIKTLQRQSYGIRDRKYFELLIYSLHQTRYALVGWAKRKDKPEFRTIYHSVRY